MNTTFTTYAEKKAKQFLNLLQGYTKGIRITAILILLLMGVSNVWAASTVTGGHIYFDELNSGYTGAGDMQFWVGHDKYSRSYSMSKIDNTKLWYCTAPNWSDATYFAFTSGANWGGADQKYYDRIGSNPWKSAIKGNYALDSSSKLFVFRVASTANKAAVISDSPYGYQGTSYTSLNKTITIKAKVSTDGGSSYSEASTPAKLTGSSKVFTSTSSCAGISGASATLNAGSSSTTFKAGYTANTTLTAVAATGYTFAGWYTDSKVSSELEPTVNPAGATTYYAYYKANQYTITYKDQGGSDFSGTHADGHPTTHTYGTETTLETASKTGYNFDGWHTDATCTQRVTSLGATAYTADITLYAKWTPVPTLEISTNQQYLRAGKDKLQLDIDYKNIPEGHYYRVHATPEAYFNGNEKGDNVDKVEIKGTNQTNFISSGFLSENTYTVELILLQGETSTGIKSNQITITVEPHLSVQTRARFNDDISTTAAEHPAREWVYPSKNVGEVITANTPKTGYTFDGWTANDNNLITFETPNEPQTIVKSKVNGNNQACAYANYTEIKHSIAVETNNDNLGTISPTSTTAGIATPSAYVTATPKTGCRFTGWTATDGITIENPSNQQTRITKATKAGTLTANFEENKYAVQVSVAAGQESWGSVSTTSTSVGSVSAQQITATANTNLGYVFDHWELSDGITITSGNANNATIEITATKTGSLTAHFRGENRPQNVFLIGDMNNWQAADANWQFYKLPGENGNTVTLTKTINKSDYHAEGYKFGVNIYQAGWDDKWWHNSAENDTKMDAHNCTGWVFGTKDGDKKTFIDLNVSGEYTFTLAHSGTYDQQALSITYPDKSFIEGDFATAWDENAYPLTENGDIQTVTIPITSKKDVEFRLVSHGKLFGSNTKILVASNSQTLSSKNMEDEGAVMKIGAYLEGDYTFSFDQSKKKLTVTYPVVNQLQVYRSNPEHAEAINNWNWDHQDGSVYTKALSLNANTTYEFKTVVNSDFFGKSTTLTRQSSSTTLSTSGGDVKITTDVAGNYIFTYNSESKQLSVTYPEAYTFTYGIGKNSNGLGTVAVTPDIASGTLVAAGTDLELSATPNLGYKFVGWYREAACTNQVSTANPYNFPINSTTTLYAKFERRDLYIHTDIIWDWGTALMTQDKNNKAVYTYTTTLEQRNSGQVGDAWDVGYHFHFVNTPTNPNGNIAYNWHGVQTPTGTNIDGPHLTDPGNPTIQFGLTRKSDVTITLTLQSPNDDPKPTVRIDATPYYNITLDQTGCAQPAGTQTVEVKSGNAMPEIVLPEAPTGYNFGGYYDQKDGAGNKYYNADGTSANTWDKNDDGTLYAQWTPKEYTITYNLNDGSGTMTPTTYTIESETFALPDNPTKTGHTFAGWYANAELTGVAVTHIEKGSTGNKEYWAKWDVASYTITFDTEGGSGGTSTLDVPFGTQLPDITIPTNAGHLFLGYYNGDGGTGTQYYDASGKGLKTMPANNLTLHAKWLSSSDCIFFYNNLGWKDVYVYFYSSDKYWDDSKGTGSKNDQTFPQDGDAEHKPHYYGYRGKMTKIEGTSIWYYNRSVHDEITRDNYTTVAFTEKEQYDFEFFYETEVVRRGDFNSNVPMFVSMKVNKVTKNNNKTSYYNTGYWMNYPTNTGYKLHIFDENGNTINAQLVDIPFEYGDNMIMPWSVNVSLEGAKTYAFKIQRVDGTNEGNGTWYGNNGKMTTNSSGDVGQTAWEFTTGTDNCKITTTAPGTYVFTLKYDKDAHSNYNYLVGVEYPASVGDYRLAYQDNAHPFHPGHLLKKREGKDTVSFFVHYNESPVIMLQQVTDINANTGAITWTTKKTYALTANQAGSEHPGQAMMPGRRMANEVILHIGGESLDGIDLTGIYNFVLEQTADEATLQGSATKYDGDFYIRTNAAAGGWVDFRQAGNKMTYSSYAESNSDFNHYFVKWINAGTNVKFTIANEYSYCLSDSLDADDIVTTGNLPADANVRFGWNSKTNELTRAYIAGSSNASDRFLVLEGNEDLKDINGNALHVSGLNPNEAIFSDKQNWIYQLDVQANNNTEITLTAKYNGKVQTFFGTQKGVMQATNDKYHKVRMIYDFKTNNLIAAWLLDTPVQETEAESVASNMLIIREDQGEANQINFTNNQDMEIYTAYAVMTFTKDWVLDESKRSLSKWQRTDYWVSFPFDVNLSDVFGFGEYGDQWIMLYYDGAERAEKGGWKGTTYWKYITNRNEVLKAGVGYVLKLNPTKMEKQAFANNATDASLFFPSQGIPTIINHEPKDITVDEHTCTIERDNRNIYDSHWNLIGVPGFADLENLNVESLNREVTISNKPHNLAFYYEYNAVNNTYNTSLATATFKNMYAYMVQYAGKLEWTNLSTVPQQLAARRNSNSNKPEKLTLRLEIAQGEEIADQTFVQLQQEGATREFDMNIDLTKIINSGANIYTLVGNDRIQTAGNALPMEEVVVPVGVQIAADGEYTFRMPEGTEGMVVELVDYETYNRTNLLLTDYTVTLPKGTSENRFALHIQPQKDVVTSLENIGEGVNNGEAVNKYLIDGKLIIRTAEGIFDAQGHRL